LTEVTPGVPTQLGQRFPEDPYVQAEGIKVCATPLHRLNGRLVTVYATSAVSTTIIQKKASGMTARTSRKARSLEELMTGWCLYGFTPKKLDRWRR